MRAVCITDARRTRSSNRSLVCALAGAPEATAAKILLVGHVDVKTGLDQALYDTAQQEGWLEMRAQVPRSEAQRLLEEADALLLVQPQSDVQVPGKLFEYICIGRPILALVPRASAIEHILQKSGDPACLHLRRRRCRSTADQKLLEFLRLPTYAQRPSEWFRTNFNAEEQTKKLAEIIDAVSK